MKILFKIILILFFVLPTKSVLASNDNISHVAHVPMDMMILTGTGEYLKSSIENAHSNGAKLLVITLDTPGGMLHVSQDMVQQILNAPLPVVVFVAPKGGTATSAGVFITLAGHVAAMSPGTSIGAAHPVQGDGKNIESDMRAKAENMTIAMVRAISEARGRNVEWAEKSVKESASVTEQEALKLNVIDLIAEDIPDLLEKLKGRKIKVGQNEMVLDDYSKLPLHEYQISFRDKAINVLADPNIAALLWLGATTGITLELYNPGAILPGVVGVICLLLALLVSSVIPISQGGLLLFILGAMLLALEVYVGSGILGFGGLVALSLGAVYLIDIQQAPDMTVSLELILPIILLAAGFLIFAAREVRKAYRKNPSTGVNSLIGQQGVAAEKIADKGRIFINGEYWNTRKSEDQPGIIEKGDKVEVISSEQGLELIVRKVNNS
jgi:membrane-bound serine protease (ClpP class)